MLPLDHPDGIHIAFDDHRLVANAGLILPATLALHLGLPQLVQTSYCRGPKSGYKMQTASTSPSTTTAWWPMLG